MKLEYEIANRIKELRRAKNMTQEQLAEKIGVDTSFLGRIERGKAANIQVNTLEKIINALDEEYSVFFTFENTSNRYAELLHKLSLSKNESQLLEIFESIIKLEEKS
ncbi:helix-turn-helix domain-containing protein [Staphylococcus simulans]|uniref:helix-turn-helix domain-containing protein n=1 Tax=Staphylococcus simulans TaxID=1286 RepID=UPI000D1EBAA9|nr:helix-turn-helix transcriptional regulator [Staphylococcus simulans]MDY5059765.1 helix-turn-helix transcriptional regulator [Staphylococcus simulans]PTJ20430.1 XRE family transcriptional regulator [Staphylococcus simulans]